MKCREEIGTAIKSRGWGQKNIVEKLENLRKLVKKENPKRSAEAYKESNIKANYDGFDCYPLYLLFFIKFINYL